MNDYVHATGIIIENDKGEMLLLLRNKQNPEGETWGLVGGKVTENEDPVDSTIGKIQQEIGVKIEAQDLMFIRTFYWNRTDIKLKFDVFKVRKNISNIQLNKDGHTDFMWISPKDAVLRKDLMIGLYEILKFLL